METMTAVKQPRIVFHRNWADLHPDDGETRAELRKWMRNEMTRQGLGELAMSLKAGHRRGWARSVFEATSWRLATVQHFCATLGYELEFHAAWQYGEGMADEPPELLAALEIYRPGSPGRASLQRQRLADYGRRLREAKGISVPELASRLSMTPTHLRDWEECDRDDYLVLTAQRYFRALGNPLRLILCHESGSRVYLGPRRPPPPPATVSGPVVQITEEEDSVWVRHRDSPFPAVRFTRDEWHEWLNSDL